MNEDTKFLLQVGAPFMASLIYSVVSWYTHRQSRNKVDEIHRVVANGQALREWKEKHR